MTLSEYEDARDYFKHNAASTMIYDLPCDLIPSFLSTSAFDHRSWSIIRTRQWMKDKNDSNGMILCDMLHSCLIKVDRDVAVRWRRKLMRKQSEHAGSAPSLKCVVCGKTVSGIGNCRHHRAKASCWFWCLSVLFLIARLLYSTFVQTVRLLVKKTRF